jgi:hypothetical protein
MQNQLENRQLQTYENLYNYRFDPRFRAMYTGPLAQFSTEMLNGMTPDQIKELEKLLAASKAAGSSSTTTNTTTIRNGGIVKAIKSM